MLVCPDCQFENPNTNKFCQKCGTSLTHKVCSECKTQVPLNLVECPNCGATTGTVWWAILSKDSNSQLAASGSTVGEPEAATAPSSGNREVADITSSAETTQPLPAASLDANAMPTEVTAEPDETTVPLPNASGVQELQATSVPAENTLPADSIASTISPSDSVSSTDVQTLNAENPLTASSSAAETSTETTRENSSSGETNPITPQIVYLDPQQRYQLLDALPSYSDKAEVMVRVLDCQPFQKAPLTAIMEQLQGSEAVNAGSNSETVASSAQSVKNRNFIDQTLNVNSLAAKSIPNIAQAYLDLQNNLSPTLPAIHDAWQQDSTSVVLLEDRSQWPLLNDLGSYAQIPLLQILYWLDEMAKLWVALEPWQMRQSLLELSNLRVDEDQTLCLQRLYKEPANATLSLQNLGQVWKELFELSGRSQLDSLEKLLDNLQSGKIQNPSDLRSQLQAIAEEQEDSQVSKTRIQPPLPSENRVPDASEGDDMPTIILPMQLLSLDDAGCTDIGRQREHNEDNFGINTEVKKQETPLGRTVQARGLYILCDGMGGHAGGEVASVMAVDTIRRYFQDNWQSRLPTEDRIREAVLLANKAIFDINQQQERSGSGRMGTTLVMVLIEDTKVAIAHVGDSRLYRLSRKRGLEQITIDHEVGQREIQRGVDPAIAYARPDAYQLTQALGPRDENFVRPDVQFLELNEDTLLLLCSDGLSDNDLIETHWQTHLLPLLSSRANLDQGLLQLIDLANQHNGHDNITAVAIRAKVRPNLDQHQMF
ncbi:serine/threonine phosphatase [Coleofasciculus sp. FACHB-1120]|uniref:serine/threonine phosphatase n=1 Tax=Coleofasciculus sp. FACHB-1120 TaxID=2692783 RepID=UPI001686D64B|nr:serine/threonine phosphatase [Coleofasciculus sp. FACHB-1120]MBD2740880.1 serine/threonine phosphatase [Coleofasciculus sp. FACHB-1120]